MNHSKIAQVAADRNQYSQQWYATSVSGAAISGLFKGMYTLAASHSNMVMGVASGAEGATVAQYTYSAQSPNPMHQWYALPVGSGKYQFVNRSSGKCLALASDSATAKAVQKTCANNESQKFTPAVSGGADIFTLQLIFAGGKKVMGGADENPFIAQLATGTQVAIDPSGHMLPGSGGSTGSCIASDILVDLTKLAGGAAGPPAIPAACCVKYTGVSGLFEKSAWSTTTFLCK